MTQTIVSMVSLVVGVMSFAIGPDAMRKLTVKHSLHRRIEECRVMITGTGDGRIRAAWGHELEHLIQIRTCQVKAPGHAGVGPAIIAGYLVLLASLLATLPLFGFGGIVGLAAVGGNLIGAILVLHGLATLTNDFAEQRVYGELGYPERFERLPLPRGLAPSWFVLRSVSDWTENRKQHSRSMNPTNRRSPVMLNHPLRQQCLHRQSQTDAESTVRAD